MGAIKSTACAQHHALRVGPPGRGLNQEGEQLGAELIFRVRLDLKDLHAKMVSPKRMCISSTKISIPL